MQFFNIFKYRTSYLTSAQSLILPSHITLRVHFEQLLTAQLCAIWKHMLMQHIRQVLLKLSTPSWSFYQYHVKRILKMYMCEHMSQHWCVLFCKKYIPPCWYFSFLEWYGKFIELLESSFSFERILKTNTLITIVLKQCCINPGSLWL